MKPEKHEYRSVEPNYAERLLRHVDPEWQRKLSPAHIKHLARMMNDGIFETGHIVVAQLNGETRIANGMHTLHAIVASGCTVRALLEWYQCRNDEEYIELFHRFDTESRKRTNQDSAKAFLMGYGDELQHVSPTVLSRFRAGLEMAEALVGASRIKLTQYYRHKQILHHREEFLFYLSLDGLKAARELLDRAPVIAAAIVTFRANENRARKFWGQVVTGFFDKNMPTYPPVKLNRYLQAVSIGGGAGGNSSGSTSLSSRARLVPRHQVYAICIRAWNAYIENRMLKVLKAFGSGKKSVPEVLG